MINVRQCVSKIPSALEEYLPSGEETIPEGMEVYDLIKAMQRVMQRRALLQPLESKIARVEISIDERTEQIRSYFLLIKIKLLILKTCLMKETAILR